MGRPAERPTWAAAIFEHIPEVGVDGDIWRGKAELAALTGLTAAQVAAAVAYLRDTYPDLPLVSGRDGYRWSTDADDVVAFRQWRARTAHTTMRRLWTGVMKPYLDELGDAKVTNPITKQFERLLEDMGELTA